jgi:hypothetical protein
MEGNPRTSLDVWKFCQLGLAGTMCTLTEQTMSALVESHLEDFYFYIFISGNVGRHLGWRSVLSVPGSLSRVGKGELQGRYNF